MYSHHLGRCMSPKEALVAQGFPASLWAARSMGCSHRDLSEVSGNAAFKLAGNAMHTACVGSVLAWIVGYTEPIGVTASEDCSAKPSVGDAATVAGSTPLSDSSSFSGSTLTVVGDEPLASVPPLPACAGSESRSVSVTDCFPPHVRALVGRLKAAAFGEGTVLANSLLLDRSPGPRSRELLPLPAMPRDVLLKALPDEFRENESDVECLQVFCEVAVLSLNALSARRHPVSLGADPPSRAQHASLRHISDRCFGILRRFSRLPLQGLIEEHHLESFEPSSAPPRPQIVADYIDLPVHAATCDPRRLVTSHMCDTLDHISDIFPDKPIGVKSVRVGKRDMGECVRFVRRMLEVDKVQLIADPKGVASFFVVGKPGKSRLRPI